MKRSYWVKPGAMAGAVLLALAAVAAWSGAALAAEGGETSMVGVFGGGYHFDKGQYLDDSLLVGARAGTRFEGGEYALEYYLGYAPANGTNGTKNNNFILLGFEGLYRFTPESPVVPFVALGLAVAAFSPAVEGEDRRTLASLGGGAEWSLGPAFSLRADGRFYTTLSGSKRPNWSATVGLGWDL